MKSDLTLASSFEDEDDPITCVAEAIPARAPSSINDEDDGDDIVLVVDEPSCGKVGGSTGALSEALSEAFVRAKKVLLALFRVEEIR